MVVGEVLVGAVLVVGEVVLVGAVLVVGEVVLVGAVLVGTVLVGEEVVGGYWSGAGWGSDGWGGARWGSCDCEFSFISTEANNIQVLAFQVTYLPNFLMCCLLSCMALLMSLWAAT